MKELHPLDNIAWNSLTTRHRALGVVGEKAAAYHPQISMIAAVAEETTEAYNELATIIQQGDPVALIGNKVPDNIPQWTIMRRAEAYQMTTDKPIDYRQAEVEPLTPVDVPAIMELVKLTNPGPFSHRTIEMGTYIGIKKHGQLIAMGGERMKPQGYTEISAICTHPEHRGKGYATTITGILTNHILEQGETPILHVFTQNTPATKLYQKLGYKTRTKIPVTAIMKKPTN